MPGWRVSLDVLAVANPDHVGDYGAFVSLLANAHQHEKEEVAIFEWVMRSKKLIGSDCRIGSEVQWQGRVRSG